MAGARLGAPDQDRQLSTMRSELDLSEVQTARLTQLLISRETRLAHLRNQMKTTLTPRQQIQAREILAQRGKPSPLSDQEREQLRTTLGVSERQVQQFQIYRQKISDFRKETLALVNDTLQPEQRPRLQALALEF